MIDPTIPQESMDLMMGERQRTHGDPKSTLARMGQFWTGYLGVDVHPYDVANLMALSKIARAKHSYHRDHFVDAIAYLLLAESIGRED